MNILRALCRWLVHLCIHPVQLCRFSGVPVKWHASWLLFPGGYFVWVVASGTLGLQPTAVLVAGLLFSLLAHEFAHVWAARAFGCRTRSVVILPIGCVALLREEPEAGEEFWVALAGPAMSLLLALVTAVALAFCDEPVRRASHFHPMLWTFGFVNVGIALFNLLPCLPMDGGRMLRAAVGCGLRWVKPGLGGRAQVMATRIAVRWVGIPLALGLIVFTVCVTHCWQHLVLFALVIWLGELEYRRCREECRSQRSGKYLKLPHTHHPFWHIKRGPASRRQRSQAESPAPLASLPLRHHAPA